MSINRHHARQNIYLDGREWTTLGDQNAGEWSKQKDAKRAGEASRVLTLASLLQTTECFALPRQWPMVNGCRLERISSVSPSFCRSDGARASKEAVNVKGKNKVSTLSQLIGRAYQPPGAGKVPYLLQTSTTL